MEVERTAAALPSGHLHLEPASGENLDGRLVHRTEDLRHEAPVEERNAPAPPTVRRDVEGWTMRSGKLREETLGPHESTERAQDPRPSNQTLQSYPLV
jgi:hypothetical protein